MIITLDGRRLDDTFAPEGTLQTLIDQVRAVHLDDRLVISVAVDGRRLGDTELGASLEQPAASNAQVDLESGDRHALVADALRGLALEFEQAGGRCTAIADQLSSDGAPDAIREVGTVIGLWQTCYRAIGQCSGLLGQDLTQCEHDGQTVRAWLEHLIEKLTVLRGALEAHDTVLLADLVRYEFPPLAAAWQAMLNTLAAEVAPGPTA